MLLPETVHLYLPSAQQALTHKKKKAGVDVCTELQLRHLTKNTHMHVSSSPPSVIGTGVSNTKVRQCYSCMLLCACVCACAALQLRTPGGQSRCVTLHSPAGWAFHTSHCFIWKCSHLSFSTVRDPNSFTAHRKSLSGNHGNRRANTVLFIQDPIWITHNLDSRKSTKPYSHGN